MIENKKELWCYEDCSCGMSDRQEDSFTPEQLEIVKKLVEKGHLQYIYTEKGTVRDIRTTDLLCDTKGRSTANKGIETYDEYHVMKMIAYFKSGEFGQKHSDNHAHDKSETYLYYYFYPKKQYDATEKRMYLRSILKCFEEKGLVEKYDKYCETTDRVEPHYRAIGPFAPIESE